MAELGSSARVSLASGLLDSVKAFVSSILASSKSELGVGLGTFSVLSLSRSIDFPSSRGIAAFPAEVAEDVVEDCLPRGALRRRCLDEDIVSPFLAQGFRVLSSNTER
ncbi:unnamed protein product [Phytomonas sp. EM1]|nr:unnamed protein product [Phytomonas sp. EM1]|eukprot:CCW61633.1 unnamed protein product [Phytomonas sp. isolate EM1]